MRVHQGLECAAALVGWGADVTMVFPEALAESRSSGLILFCG